MTCTGSGSVISLPPKLLYMSVCIYIGACAGVAVARPRFPNRLEVPNRTIRTSSPPTSLEAAAAMSARGLDAAAAIAPAQGDADGDCDADGDGE